MSRPDLHVTRCGKAAIVILAALVVVGAASGLIYYFATRPDGERPKSAGTGDSPSAKTDEPQGYAALPVEEETSLAIAASAGGTLELKDGSRVEFPAGALAADRTVRLARLKPTGPGEPSIILDIDAGEGDLSQEAIVTVPAPQLDLKSQTPGAPNKYLALHVHGNERRVMAADYDAARNVVTVRTKRFSIIHVIVIGALVLEEALREEIQVAGENGILLPVPYYPQGDAGWCWAACSQMLRKHYGKESEIWDIAKSLDAPFDKGFSGVDVLTRVMTTLIDGTNLEVDASLLGYFNVTHLTEYIVSQIQLGRPVWVALPGIQHVVLVVGYDKTGLYIHDPGGALLEALYKIFPSSNPGGELDERLCGVHLSWVDWRAIFAPSEAFLEQVGTIVQPAGHTMVVEDAEPLKDNTLTLTVHHNDIEFLHPSHPGAGAKAVENFENRFLWDGTAEHGHRFKGVQELIQGFPFFDPTNSDRLSKFVVTLNNSSLEPARDVRVRLLLDKKEFRSKAGIEIPRKTSNFRVDLMEAGPHDFRTANLPPGDYVFLAAVEVGGVTKDIAEIPFRMGPSRPENLRAEATADKVRLSWTPCPEPRLQYVIWQDRKLFAAAHDAFFETDDDHKEHVWTVEAVQLPDDVDELPGFSDEGELDTNWRTAWLSSYLSEQVKTAAGEKKMPEPMPPSPDKPRYRLKEITVNREYDPGVEAFGGTVYKKGEETVGGGVRSFELKAVRPDKFRDYDITAVLTVDAPAEVVEDGEFPLNQTATATCKLTMPEPSPFAKISFGTWDNFSPTDRVEGTAEKPLGSGTYNLKAAGKTTIKAFRGGVLSDIGMTLQLQGDTHQLSLTFVYEQVK